MRVRYSSSDPTGAPQILTRVEERPDTRKLAVAIILSGVLVLPGMVLALYPPTFLEEPATVEFYGAALGVLSSLLLAFVFALREFIAGIRAITRDFFGWLIPLGYLA